MLGRHHFNPRRSKWFEMQEVQAKEKEKGGKKKWGRFGNARAINPTWAIAKNQRGLARVWFKFFVKIITTINIEILN